MKSYLNTYEHRLAIINSNISLLENSWEELSNEQKVELFSIAIEKRNMQMIEWLGNNRHQKLEENIFVDMVSNTLEQAGKDGDLPMVLAMENCTTFFKMIYGHGANYIQDKILDWATKSNYIRLITQLDFKNLDKFYQLKLLIALTNQYKININNKIEVGDNNYQILINLMSENKINIFSHIQEMLRELISPKRIYMISKKYSSNIQETRSIIERYINDNNFLSTLLKKYSQQYPYSTIKELKQHLLDSTLAIALKAKNIEVTQYLLENSAVIRNEDELLILLKKSTLSLTQIIIDLGYNIKPYLKEVLEYQVKFHNIEKAQFLISLFENKKNAWNIIEKVEIEDNDLYGIQNEKLSMMKKELKKIIDNYLFEEKLQKELVNQEKINQRKI